MATAENKLIDFYFFLLNPGAQLNVTLSFNIQHTIIQSFVFDL